MLEPSLMGEWSLAEKWAEIERDRVMPCPGCGRENGLDWMQCECGLHREGWLTGNTVWYGVWKWKCAKCGTDNETRLSVNGAKVIPPVGALLCESEYCEDFG